MAKRIFGFIVIGIGFLGVLYFKSYKGDLISFPMLWLLVSIGVVALGTYVAFTARTKKQVQEFDNLKSLINRIRENGEKIEIDFDKCDFKTTNVYDSVSADSFSKIKIIDSLFDQNRNFRETGGTQTYIIYKHQNGDILETFVSQPFTTELTTLKYNVSNNELVLYIDQQNRKLYFFDVKR